MMTELSLFHNFYLSVYSIFLITVIPRVYKLLGYIRAHFIIGSRLNVTALAYSS